MASRDHGASGWSDVRIALGSVAATPICARETGAAIEGRRPTREVADQVAETLVGEIQRIDDVRSTAELGRVVVARLLLREAAGW